MDAPTNDGKATAMLRFLRKMIARMGLAGAVVLALAVVTPAFASHACINEACAPAGQAAVETPADADDSCPDCGPACANGCCHAPHAATAPELSAPSSPPQIARAEVWVHEAAPPLARPAGPDRPPRL
jgi:hypothetical protein